MRLRDRVAVVTGGSSGIGRGICVEFARQGAHVVVADLVEMPKPGKYHDQDVVTPTVTEIDKEGGSATFVQVDMGDPESVEALIAEAVRTYGGLDILVNNAGIYIPGNSRELSVADWDRMVAVNLRGLFVSAKFALPHLEQSAAGRIINTASVAAYEGQIGQAAYSSAKGGVVALTLPAARELSRFGIRVMTIAPGRIGTPMLLNMPDEVQESLAGQVPFPSRFGKPEEFADLISHIIDNEMLNGEVIRLDGAIRLAPK